jgi:hypothetical protein
MTDLTINEIVTIRQLLKDAVKYAVEQKPVDGLFYSTLHLTDTQMATIKIAIEKL